MPTNEERREVADRFRDFETLRPIFKESNICAFLEALGVKGYLSWEDICEKLADLIEPEPERTCEHLTAICDKIESVAGTYSTLQYIDAQTARETLMNISAGIRKAIEEAR